MSAEARPGLGGDSDAGLDAEAGRVLDAYLAERAAGCAVDLEQLCAEHSHLANRLRACLDVLAWADAAVANPLRASAATQPDDSRAAAAYAAPPTVPCEPTELLEAPGTIIGPYTLLQQIGEGGMGVVYLAEQTRPVRRKVALKIIKPGMDTKQVIARFDVERQALALMDHPNIARVLDVGATDAGRPYFVMEVVKGAPITTYCDAVRLPTKDRLALFVPVCHAIQHAHQKGVIHRDIKPSNVLVAMIDGKPLAKVIDFGVAKAIDQRQVEQTLFTRHGDLVGTLEYMSPEQAELSRLDIDTRSDVYSLGVLLYELLTGTTPLDREQVRRSGYAEVLRRIREDDPPTPSTRLSRSGDRLAELAALRRAEPARLTKQLRGDLDWIVMKALDKDRTRRYETANALARDIERYLADEPVEASPPSGWYRVGKFVRRNRPLLRTAFLIALALIAMTAVSMWQAAVARRARDATRHLLYVSDIRLSDQLVREGLRARAKELLLRHLPARDEDDLRSFPWYYLMRLCDVERLTLRGHTAAVYHAEFSADGRTVVTCGKDGTVRFWETVTGQPVKIIDAHQSEVNWASFSPDGKILATAGDDGTIRLWDIATCAEQRTISAHEGDAVFVVFNSDGTKLVSYGRTDHRVKVWDAKSGRGRGVFRAHDSPIVENAVDPDRTKPPTSSATRYVSLWQLLQVGPGSVPLGDHTVVYIHPFSRDGSRLACTTKDDCVAVWDVRDDRPHPLSLGTGHRGAVQSLALLPDGSIVASAGDDATVKLWDAATGACLATLRGHTGRVWEVSVSPDASTLASAGEDGTVRLWETSAAIGETRLLTAPIRPGRFMDMVFSEDNKMLIGAQTISEPEEYTEGGWCYPHARLQFNGFDVASGQLQFSRDARGLKDVWPAHTGLSPDGAYAVTRSNKGDASTIWDVATAQPLVTVEGRVFPQSLANGHPRSGAFQRPNRPIAFGDVISARALRELPGTDVLKLGLHDHVTVSPDLQMIATVDDGALLTTSRVSGRRVHTRLATDLFRRAGIQFSADSERLAVGSVDSVIVFKAGGLEHTGTALRLGTDGEMETFKVNAFSPDGKVLAIGTTKGNVVFWDVGTQTELFTLRRKGRDGVFGMRFSPDGRTLALWMVDSLSPPANRLLVLLPTALRSDR